MMSSFKPLISGWAKLAGKVSWSFSLNHPTLATPRDNGVASGTDNALLGSSVRSPQERPDDGTFFKKISPRISRYLHWRYERTLSLAIWGDGISLIIAALHTAYIGEDSSISGTEDPGMQGSRCHEAMKPKDPFV